MPSHSFPFLPDPPSHPCASTSSRGGQALNLPSSCLCLLNTGITGVHSVYFAGKKAAGAQDWKSCETGFFPTPHRQPGPLTLWDLSKKREQWAVSLQVWKAQQNASFFPAPALRTNYPAEKCCCTKPKSGCRGPCCFYSSAMVKTSLCQQQPLAQDSFWVTACCQPSGSHFFLLGSCCGPERTASLDWTLNNWSDISYKLCGARWNEVFAKKGKDFQF